MNSLKCVRLCGFAKLERRLDLKCQQNILNTANVPVKTILRANVVVMMARYLWHRRHHHHNSGSNLHVCWGWHFSSSRIFVQVTIYRGLLLGRDGHLDQSKATIYRDLYENTASDCYTRGWSQRCTVGCHKVRRAPKRFTCWLWVRMFLLTRFFAFDPCHAASSQPHGASQWSSRTPKG